MSMLTRNRSFLSFLGTQALGAFNDNLFKQMILLLGLGYVALGVDFQTLVQLLFALPFLLFSGLAGDLSDRVSKGWLMVVCKVAEVGVMTAGCVGFLALAMNTGDSLSIGSAPPALVGLAIVMFVMGTQSAFFGPPKYGGLVELVDESDLSKATGLTQMTTFLSIIFGVAVAGFLVDVFASQLVVPGLFTVGIAIVGTLVAMGIARRKPTDPSRRIGPRSLVAVLPTLRAIFRKDPFLWRVMLVYSWFWFVGGVSLPAINVYGRLQLGMNNFYTSLLVSTLSVGIAVGSVLVGRLSKDKIRLNLVPVGLVTLSILLAVICFIPVHSPTPQEIEQFAVLKNQPAGSLSNVIPIAPLSTQVLAFLAFFFLGGAAGFYSVPLLAFVQARPESQAKGKTFAAVNWLNWVFIVLSAVLYGIGVSLTQSRANLIFLGLGVSTLLIGLFYLPKILRDPEASA